MNRPTAHRVLILDDEADVRAWLVQVLSEAGFDCSAVDNGAAMRKALQQQPHSLVLMDLRLRNEDGLTLARELRRQSNVPIIMISGKSDETDRVLGLELVADDFLSKPFSGRELVARVRASLRRCNELSLPGARRDDTPHERYRFGDWLLDLTARSLARSDGAPCELTPAEFALLAALVRQPGRVWSRDDLLCQFRGADAEVYDRSVDVLILRLRRKIEPNPRQPQYVRTERGLGYLFEGTVTRA